MQQQDSTSPSSSSSEPSSSGRPPPAALRWLLARPRLLGASTALAGMVLGAVVGIAVQAGVESTGLLGPSVDALIAEQESNFGEVHSRLDALQNAASDPEVRQGLAELAALLERQDELTRQANGELRYLGEQVSSLKDQQLAASGMSGGADLWLKAGEGVNVGSRNQVFGLLRAQSNFVDVNLSGMRKRLVPGDMMQVEADGRVCSVFFKQAAPRADGRVGFDLHCS